MDLYLFIDFGSTYTKLTAIGIEKEEVVATSKDITTIDTNILDGYNNAFVKLERDLPKGFNILKRYACSSAAGGLKMIVVGNVPELTTEAAKKAALGAGARVLKAYHFDLSRKELDEIVSMDVDIILLAGGTDGGNKQYVINNASKLAKENLSIPIIMAGNKACQDEVIEIFSTNNTEYYITSNIMPQLNKLNIEPVRTKIREVFMEKIIYAKGLDKAISLVDGDIIPTPLSVLNAGEVLSLGSDAEHGIGDLIIVDIGGATTDIHSIAEGLPSKGDVVLKGLEEPLLKRTVEGDLGMRYSAVSLQETATSKLMKIYLSRLGYDLSIEEIKKECKKRHNDIIMVPITSLDIAFDEVMASVATSIAMTRHSGKVETVFTPIGQAYFQLGKDLLELKNVIGTGGVIIHSENPVNILKEASYSKTEPNVLKPLRPNYLIDKDYILSAIGLLVNINKDMSVRMLKKYLYNL